MELAKSLLAHAHPSAPAANDAELRATPLPFDPTKLHALSERLIVAHHANGYAGAVKRVGAIRDQLRALPANAAPLQVGALKREELAATNSMVLHELYFENLGGDGRHSGLALDLIRNAFGSLEAWEWDFRLTGMSLAAGSGWVLLAYHPREQAVRNHWCADHTNAPAGATPLLVMDMYEHAYDIDYGADAKAYVDAFLKNVQWEVVSRRAEHAVHT